MPFDGPSGYALALREMAKAWAPRRPLGTRAWSDRYAVLSGKSAAEPGPWRTERMPFLAGIMDAMDWGHPAKTVLFVGSAQIAKSALYMNKIGQIIHQDPAPVLVLFPNEKQGRKWKAVRFDPMVGEIPVLRALIPRGRKADSGNTQTQVQFPGGVLFTGSGNIPSDMASISVRYLFVEELDRLPPVIDDEGDPVELALARLAAFDSRCKAFFNSTPTTEEISRIWPLWLGSTMDRYHMPCPHCGHMQYLRFAALRWPDGKPSAAVYECEDKGCTIEEHAKTDMLAAGEWRAEHPEREAETKGFHANGLMTPLGLGRTWANHAAAWDRAQGSPARVQVFQNTRMGEIVKNDKVKVEWEAIASRREPYTLRSIPAGNLLLTAGVDFQADRLEAAIIGIGRGERITVLDYVVQYGDPTRSELWQWLDSWLAQPIVNSFGVPMRLAASMLDSGNWQQEVINFTRTRKARGIFAGKGSSVRSRQPIGKPTLIDVNFRGSAQKRGAEQYQIGVTMIKKWLYSRLVADAGTIEKPVRPADRHVRLSVDLSDDWCRQLAAERYDERAGWFKVYSRNEALDTIVLAIASAQHHTVAVHRYRELDWQRLEQLYEPKAASDAGQPARPVDSPLGKIALRIGGGFLPTSAMVGTPS